MRVKNFFKLLAKILLGLVVLLACLIAFIVLQPAYTNAIQIDFTRHISQYHQEDENPLLDQESFFGVPGGARLIVTNSGEGTTATIQLNGTEVAGPDSFSGTGQFEIPVTLLENNNISVALNGVSVFLV